MHYTIHLLQLTIFFLEAITFYSLLSLHRQQWWELLFILADNSQQFPLHSSMWMHTYTSLQLFTVFLFAVISNDANNSWWLIHSENYMPDVTVNYFRQCAVHCFVCCGLKINRLDKFDSPSCSHSPLMVNIPINTLLLLLHTIIMHFWHFSYVLPRVQSPSKKPVT